MLLAYLRRQAANTSSIEVRDVAPLWLPLMRDLQCLTPSWLSCSRWGRERVASSFSFKGGQYLSYDYLQPVTTWTTQDARPNIIAAPFTLISRMGQGACLSSFWLERRPVHPKTTMMYHCYYFMINCRISQCDPKLNNLKCRARDSTRWVQLNSLKPVSCLVQVQIWSTQKQQVGFLYGFGTNLHCFSGLYPDHWQVTCILC